MKHLNPPRFMLIAYALVVLVGITASCERLRNQDRWDEVRSIWNQLPIYPGMVEVPGGATMSGLDKAYISKHFKSPAGYQDVKQFYQEHLNNNGWQVSREKKLTGQSASSEEVEIEFRRGAYEIVIDYAPDSSGYEWNYSVSVGWFWNM